MADLKTGNFLSDWMQDRIYGTVTEDAQGKLNAGPIMGALGGMMGYNVDAIAEQKGIDVGNKDAKATMRQLGETHDSLGFEKGQDITGEAVIAKARENKEAKETADQVRLRGYTTSDNAAAYAQQGLMGRQQIEANAAQYLHSSNQQTARYAHERGENRMDRRHQSQLADGSNDLQMQMSIMQNDLSEKRMDYDRETRSMDRRDKMIATLMSGLGSLGGTFTL